MDNTLCKSNRNYGIDLLRAVAMLLVIIFHIMNKGGLLAGIGDRSIRFYAAYWINTLSCCCVDCFVIISGYVLCTKKFRLSRFIDLWLEVVFWSVLITYVVFFASPEKVSRGEMIVTFFPVIRGRWWYVTAYFAVFLFSPALNHLIQTMQKRQLQLLLLSCFVIFGVIPILALGEDVLRIGTGYEFSWLVVLYLIGGYLRRYHNSNVGNTSRLNYLFWFFLFGLINTVYRFLVENVAPLRFRGIQFADLFLRYTSPLIVGEAICLFLLFKSFQFKEKSKAASVIAYIQPALFAVYLIHLHPLIWEYYFPNSFTWLANFGTVSMLLLTVLSSLAIFVLCVLLDRARIRIFNWARVDRLSKAIGDYIETIINVLIAKIS